MPCGFGAALCPVLRQAASVFCRVAGLAERCELLSVCCWQRHSVTTQLCHPCCPAECEYAHHHLDRRVLPIDISAAICLLEHPHMHHITPSWLRSPVCTKLCPSQTANHFSINSLQLKASMSRHIWLFTQPLWTLCHLSLVRPDVAQSFLLHLSICNCEQGRPV